MADSAYQIDNEQKIKCCTNHNGLTYLELEVSEEYTWSTSRLKDEVEFDLSIGQMFSQNDIAKKKLINMRKFQVESSPDETGWSK